MQTHRNKSSKTKKMGNLIVGTMFGDEYYIPEFNLEDRTTTEERLSTWDWTDETAFCHVTKILLLFF